MGQLGNVAIDQFYNQKVKEFLYYNWVPSSIIHTYNIGSHKKGKFHPTPRNHSLLYTLVLPRHI
jgi:hypothetical protein